MDAALRILFQCIVEDYMQKQREEPLLPSSAGVVNETEEPLITGVQPAVYDGVDLSSGKSHTDMAREQSNDDKRLDVA